MKKEKGFLSFIDDLKSEINNIKTQIDEVGIDERKSNHVKTSNKSKAKKNNKNKKIRVIRIIISKIMRALKVRVL